MLLLDRSFHPILNLLQSPTSKKWSSSSRTRARMPRVRPPSSVLKMPVYVWPTGRGSGFGGRYGRRRTLANLPPTRPATTSRCPHILPSTLLSALSGPPCHTLTMECGSHRPSIPQLLLQLLPLMSPHNNRTILNALRWPVSSTMSLETLDPSIWIPNECPDTIHHTLPMPLWKVPSGNHGLLMKLARLRAQIQVLPLHTLNLQALQLLKLTMALDFLSTKIKKYPWGL